jgi:hypothetical protein
MDPCVKLTREYKRADRALIHSTRADKAKHQAECDRAAFLLPLAKPESLPGVGDLIQHAARLASGAIHDEMQRSLHSIGARLKKCELRSGDVIALRQWIGLMKWLPVTDVYEPGSKNNILLMLGRALDFMKGPRLVKDKALAAVRPASRCAQALANAVKHQIDYDCVVFLFPLAKPESLPGAGDLIQHAARLASGAIPDEMQRALFSSAPD